MLKINKILFITLSNIGDVILTLPALDFLREKFPDFADLQFAFKTNGQSSAKDEKATDKSIQRET